MSTRGHPFNIESLPSRLVSRSCSTSGKETEKVKEMEVEKKEEERVRVKRERD